MLSIYGSNTRPHPPALKHFFRCTEQSGTTLTDIVGGCVWEPSLGGKSLLFNQAGSLGTVATDMLQSDAPIPLKSGSWHTFDAAKASLVVLSARVLSTWDDETTDNRIRFALGDLNGITGLYADHYGIGLSSSPDFHSAFGGSNALNVGTASQAHVDINAPLQVYPAGYSTEGLPVSVVGGLYSGQDILLQSVYYPTAKLDFDMYTLSDGVHQLNSPLSVTQTLCNTTTMWAPNPCLRFAKMALYGVAIFEFSNGLPADWLAASQWMAQRWKLSASERVVYPPWNGLA